MKYYVSNNGQTLEVSGDSSLFTAPGAFREVSAEEYATHQPGEIIEIPAVPQAASK